MKIFSNRQIFILISVLILVYAAACAAATLIENELGTDAAWALVYDAMYFKTVAFLLGLSIVFTFFRFRLWRPSKAAIGLAHLAFCLILAGYSATRYWGVEGMMALREGEASNQFVSGHSVLKWSVSKNGQIREKQIRKRFSSAGFNGFSDVLSLEDQPIQLRLKSVKQGFVPTIQPDSTGSPFLFMTILYEQQAMPVILEKGEASRIGEKRIAFDCSEPDMDIQISQSDSGLSILSSDTLFLVSMKSRIRNRIEPDQAVSFDKAFLYQTHSLQLVFNKTMTKGRRWYRESKTQSGSEMLFMIVDNGRHAAEIAVPVSVDPMEKATRILLDGEAVDVYYGPVVLELPFAMQLDKFEIGWYGGSRRPASYTSRGKAIRLDGGTVPFEISMNRVFKHQNWRFFQSSYDEDESGSVLSVQKDPGAFVTYIGYFISIAAMLIHLLRPGSRFRQLGRKILSVPLLMLILIMPKTAKADINGSAKIPPDLANAFGQLLVQDVHGRVKPLNTLCNEVLLKTGRKKEVDGFNGNQVVMGFLVHPRHWQRVPLVDLPHPSVTRLLGLPESSKQAALIHFFHQESGQYKLKIALQKAIQKKPSERDVREKALLKTDERVHILYALVNRQFLRLIPSENPSKAWQFLSVAADNSMLASRLNAFLSPSSFSDPPKAMIELNAIQALQAEKAGRQYPGSGRIKAELLFNRIQLFERLMPVLMGVGTVLLIFSLISVFKENSKIRFLLKWPPVFVICVLCLQGAGLGLRWYISGHAPWSNGYESMIYTSWTVLLAGVIFSRRWPLPLSASILFSALILLAAHLSWMDPQITPLVPVLKSYWLTIHVSVIMIAYGCFGFSAMLGFINLLFITFSKTGSQKAVMNQFNTIAVIIERTLLLGLVFLYIGTVFGSVWANESWGRYWGWDAKETWTLITLCLYTLLSHLFLVANKDHPFWMSALALPAFGSVLMTYFGVNYYLSGLHSYAGGNPAVLHPAWWLIPVFILIVVLIAHARYKRIFSL